MKKSKLNSRLFFLTLIALYLNPFQANATVWWPEVKSLNTRLTVYKDYDNALQFYYIPNSVQIANTPDDVKMINHGLFFDRLHPTQSTTEYHLTFQPVLMDEDVLTAEIALKKIYGEQAMLSPLPVTTVSFEVTQKITPQDQVSSPFQVFVPNWTGDLHSFSQKFSVVMRGNAYSSEPAMSRFMTNPASNAFVGTMHYGFRGVQIPFTGHMEVNVSQFMAKFRAHASAHFGFWGSADIATAIDQIKDDQGVFIEVKKDAGYESEVWKSLTDKLISTLFQPVPAAPDAPSGSTGGLFQFSASYSSVSRTQTIKIDLKEEITKDHSGDIDVEGGGVLPSQLDSRIKYLCDMWAIYDVSQDQCKNVCTPAIEYYNPTTKSCSPAFGAPATSSI